MKPSRSIQSFKSAEFAAPVTTPPRRAPSSSDIDHKRKSPLQLQQQHSTPIFGAARPPIHPHPPPPPVISDTQSESSKTSGKKEVTSRIASLWKRVEDSKKKVPKEKDAKVWISKGKVIPESERAMIKPDALQRDIINRFQANQKALAKTEQPNEPSSATASLKPRSKSRLSIRLSKFSLTATSSSKKDLHKGGSQTTPTTPTASSTPIAPTLSHLNHGDTINGNWATPAMGPSQLLRPKDNYENEPARRNFFENEPRSEESSESMSTGTDTETDASKTKRMSRLGTFLNPTTEEEERLTLSSDEQPLQQHLKSNVSRTSNRSPSAIVTPFNYNPPQAGENDAQGNELKKGVASTTSKIAMAVRRNDSYVNSMGRLREQAMAKAAAAASQQHDEVISDDHETSHTSSVVVTLV